MSEELNDLEPESELDVLKERATALGIKFSNNIKVEILREKINAKLEDAAVVKESQQSLNDLRKKMIAEETKLIRIRLQVMNPAKRGWRGEVITVVNNFIGTVKKFVPFDSRFYQHGYHVPNCIYKVLKERKYQSLSTYKDEKGREVPQKDLVPEFSIEVLPQLTPAELKQLAKEQQAGNRID